MIEMKELKDKLAVCIAAINYDVDPYSYRDAVDGPYETVEDTFEQAKREFNTMTDDMIMWIIVDIENMLEEDPESFALCVTEEQTNEMRELVIQFLYTLFLEEAKKYLCENVTVSMSLNHLVIEYMGTTFTFSAPEDITWYYAFEGYLDQLMMQMSVTTDMRLRAYQWEVYCLINLFIFRRKYVWQRRD